MLFESTNEIDFVPNAIKFLKSHTNDEVSAFSEILFNVNTPPPCFDLSGVVGPLAKHYELYGSANDLVNLLENSICHPLVTISTAIIRQFTVALSALNLKHGIRFLRLVCFNDEIAKVFKDAQPRGSEVEIENWYSFSGHARAAVVASNILLGACYNRAAAASGQKKIAKRVQNFKNAYVESCALLKIINELKIPFPESQITKAVLLFSAPTSSSYFPPATTSTEIWAQIKENLGTFVLALNNTGSAIISALIKVSSNIDSTLMPFFSIIVTAANFGFFRTVDQQKLLFKTIDFALSNFSQRLIKTMCKKYVILKINCVLQSSKPADYRPLTIGEFLTASDSLTIKLCGTK